MAGVTGVDETAKGVVLSVRTGTIWQLLLEQEMGVSWQQGAPYRIEIYNLIIRQSICMGTVSIQRR